MAYINGKEILFSPRIGSGLSADELRDIFATKEELANYALKTDFERFKTVYDATNNASEGINNYAPRKFAEYCTDGSNGAGRIVYFNYNGAHFWAIGFYTAGYGKFLLMQYGDNWGVTVFDCMNYVWTNKKIG